MTNEDKYRTLDNLRRWSEAVDDDATYSRMLAALRRIGEWEPESGEPMPYAREVDEWQAQFAAGADSSRAAPPASKLEQHALTLIGLLAALAVLLAVGWVWAMGTSADAREDAATAAAARETFAAAGNALQATLAAQETRFAVLQVQSTAGAATISAVMTSDVETIRTLGAALTAVPPTPEPLAVTAVLAGAGPVAGTVGEGVPVFYDRPASMTVTAPPGWSFNAEPDRSLQIVDSNGVAWELQLKISTLISDTVAAATTTGIPASLVRDNPDDPNSRTVDLASLPVSLPRAPGHYLLDWEAVSSDGRRMIGATPLEFEIVLPMTMMRRGPYGLRSLPIWGREYIIPSVPIQEGEEVEVIGKLDLDDPVTENGQIPPTPDFLMVRLPGRAEIYWLPSWSVDGYLGDGWEELLNSLPDVPPPAEVEP